MENLDVERLRAMKDRETVTIHAVAADGKGFNQRGFKYTE